MGNRENVTFRREVVKSKNNSGGPSFLKILGWSAGVMLVAGIVYAVLTHDDRPKAGNEAKITEALKPTGYIDGHGYVDLGLSVKWATCNIGAEASEEFGDYFAWGGTKPVVTDSEDSSPKGAAKLQSIGGNANYDAATANWGKNWRMPTKEELDELTKKCAWYITTYRDCVGYVIIGENGNVMFLPMADSCTPNKKESNKAAFYWSSTNSWNGKASYIFFDTCGRFIFDSDYSIGMSVRPVSD